VPDLRDVVRFWSNADLSPDSQQVFFWANSGLGRCDHLIDFAPMANAHRTEPSDLFVTQSRQ
jgi:hypothetical protein